MQIRSRCDHCGGEIVTDRLLLCIEGSHQGAFHPGCLRQVKDGETIGALSKKVEELTAMIGHQQNAEPK